MKSLQVLSLLMLLCSQLGAEEILLEAVRRHFPESEMEARRVVLTPEELAKVEKTSDSRLPGRTVHTRVLKKDGEITGYVYLDRHRVRTLPETLAVFLSPEGKVVAIEVLTFAEPAHYRPREKWLKLFNGKTAEEPPRYRDSIDGITGATLTGRAVTKAVRRTLAIHGLSQP